MQSDPAIEQQVDALDRGLGVLDLRGWRVVHVGGADADRWLNDLVTANVEVLQEGGSVRSLLLGPTGRLRADLLVHRSLGPFVLFQAPGQPRPVDEILAPYLLSSDVVLKEGPANLAVIPAPGNAWTVSGEAAPNALTVGPDALESWRIRQGVPRFPVDLDEGSLPAEAGLDEAPIIDRGKGCYLGQESVARVRNLGHPTRLVVAVQASDPVRTGQAVIAEDRAVGELTSADVRGGGRLAIARIRWEARDQVLATQDGVRLARR